MRRTLAAFSALTLAGLAPQAGAQEGAAAPAPSPAGAVYACNTAPAFVLSREGNAGPWRYTWNCPGQGLAQLDDVSRSAMISRGLTPGAIRTIQVAVASADGLGMCFGIRHIGAEQTLTGYTYITKAALEATAGNGQGLVPTIVQSIDQLPAAAATCRDQIDEPLNGITVGVVQALRRAQPPQQQPVRVRAPGANDI